MSVSHNFYFYFFPLQVKFFLKKERNFFSWIFNCQKLEVKKNGPFFMCKFQNFVLVAKSMSYFDKKDIQNSRKMFLNFQISINDSNRQPKLYIKMFKLFFFHILLILKNFKISLWMFATLDYITKLKKIKIKNHRTMVVQVYSEMNMLLIVKNYDVGGFVKVMCKII
jgi:hypothetical protein